jgi:hypothetical protein
MKTNKMIRANNRRFQEMLSRLDPGRRHLRFMGRSNSVNLGSARSGSKNDETLIPTNESSGPA